MGGDEMLEAEDLLHGFRQAMIRARAGIGFIAPHDGSPLVLAHRAGAGIGQQIDEDIFGSQGEHVVAGLEHGGLAGFRRDQADGFDALDAERFSRIIGHGRPLGRCGKGDGMGFITSLAPNRKGGAWIIVIFGG